jgi:hypothetical protein
MIDVINMAKSLQNGKIFRLKRKWQIEKQRWREEADYANLLLHPLIENPSKSIHCFACVPFWRGQKEGANLRRAK